jgi:photosystem II stability/assembly factor-like uncharacterized protein
MVTDVRLTGFDTTALASGDGGPILKTSTGGKDWMQTSA